MLESTEGVSEGQTTDMSGKKYQLYRLILQQTTQKSGENPRNVESGISIGITVTISFAGRLWSNFER